VVKIGLSVIGSANDTFIIEPGGLEQGGGLSGDLWKWGLKVGLFNFLVSKNSRPSYS